MMSIREYIDHSIKSRYNTVSIDEIRDMADVTKPFNEYKRVILLSDHPIFFINDIDLQIEQNLYEENKISTISKINQIGFSFLDLCDLLDIEVNNLEHILTKKIIPSPHIIKVNSIDVDSRRYLRNMLRKNIFIGLGGVVTNFLLYLDEFFKEFEYTHILRDLFFNNTFMTIFENDKLEFHNLCRLYDRNSILNDLDLLDSFELDNRKKNIQKFSTCINDSYFNPSEHLCKKDQFVKAIGAMDINTREKLYKNKFPFVATLHSGNDCYVIENQKISGHEIESYGKINVSIFLLNMLKMTEFLINNVLFKNSEELKDDNMIFKFNAKEYLGNKFKYETSAAKDFFRKSSISDKIYEKFFKNSVSFPMNNKLYVLINQLP